MEFKLFKLKINLEHGIYLLKWMILSILIGISVGLVGALFSKTLSYVTYIWNAYPKIKLLMPVAGLVIVFLYRLFGINKSGGTNLVIQAISSGEDIRIKEAPLIFIGTGLSHLVGASVGREGAALLLGGSIGNFLSKVFSLDEKDKKLLIMASMSACFSALFGTPLAAGIFCVEIYSVGIFYIAALLPCIFSAYAAREAAAFLKIEKEVFHINKYINWNPKNIAFIIIISVCIAVMAVLFLKILHESEHLYEKYFKNPYIRILIGSIIFLSLNYLIGTSNYNGGGTSLIEKVMEGDVRIYDFLLKMIFTAIALGAGFKGGEIVPSLTIGACLGAALGMLFGLPSGLSAACGMIAFFAAVTNCPLASIFMAIELFGAEGLNFFVISILVSFILSGYYSLYTAQKFPYNKSKLEYIGK